MHILFADSGGGDGVPLSSLGQYGIAGVILSILLWFAWQVYKAEKARADANEAEIRRLNELITGKFVPSLEKATSALVDANEGLKESAIALAWYDKARGDTTPPPTPRRRTT